MDFSPIAAWCRWTVPGHSLRFHVSVTSVAPDSSRGGYGRCRSAKGPFGLLHAPRRLQTIDRGAHGPGFLADPCDMWRSKQNSTQMGQMHAKHADRTWTAAATLHIGFCRAVLLGTNMPDSGRSACFACICPICVESCLLRHMSHCSANGRLAAPHRGTAELQGPANHPGHGDRRVMPRPRPAAGPAITGRTATMSPTD